MTSMMPLTERDSWKALAAHADAMKSVTLKELFAADAGRGERMTVEAEGLFLDYSKNRVKDETLKLLVDVAEEAGLRGKIDAMFRGDKINVTEQRAVLHVALRAPKGEKIFVDGEDVVPGVHAVLEKMAEFCEQGAVGRVEGAYGQADSQCGEYWDWRLGPGAGDGV